MKDANTIHARLPGFFLTLFCLVLFASVVQAADASFSWLPNPESTVSGYKINYGTTSNSYDSFVDVGNPAPVNGRIQGTVTGLIDGTTYYFAVTAYDSVNNLESDYSTELSWTASSQSGSGNPPTATNSSLTTPEDQAISGTVTAGNDSGLPITYLVQQGVTNGTLDLGSSTGSFTYTPQENFAGTNSFTFLARDDNGDSNIATVSITITAVNDPPTAQNAAFSVSEDSTASGQLQAQDPDNDSLTYSVVADPTSGSVAVNSTTGVYTYTPDANANGTDSFTFRVSDGQVTSNTATVSITITAVNDPPTAQNGAFSVSEDSTASGQLQAQDPDNDSLTYSVVADPTSGSVAVNSATGAYTYTPDANANGTDSFTFRVSDGQVTSNTATVSITITATNDPPTAQSASITVSEDSTTNGQLQAQDPDGNSLTYSAVATPTRGFLILNATGAFTYTPNTDISGTDSFTFRVSDGQATSNTATVSITISPVNDVPVAANGSLTAAFGQTASGTLQATDQENDPLTFSIASDPQQIVTLTSPTAGTYTITPVTGMASPYTFSFTVNDGTADSNTATVTVTLIEEGTITEIFGDTPDSNHPGTLADTFTNLNNDGNAAAQQIITYSWSSPTPHKPANTIIIKPDLSTLPGNILITEAKLSLYQTGANGETTYANSVHKITGKNPIIDQITGYNAFNGEPWTPVATGTTDNDIPLGLADIGPAEDTITLDSQTGYRTWTITGMVQDWVGNPAGNFGLLITGVPTNSETGRTFAATENQTGSIRPKLVISYIKKPPKPSIMSARKIN